MRPRATHRRLDAKPAAPALPAGRGRGVVVLALALAPWLHGCFLEAVLPIATKATHATPPPPQDTPPTTPAEVAAGHLTAPRFMRRLAIDLGAGLPAAADVDRLKADAKAADSLLDAYVSASAAARALSSRFPSIWNIDAATLPDLEAYAANIDPDLTNHDGASILTPALKQRIVSEVALTMRGVLEQRRPFSTLFGTPDTIVPPDLVTLYGLQDDGEAFPGEPYRYAHATDSRGDAGILASQALAAAYGDAQATPPRKRARALLGAFTCDRVEVATAHQFNGLTADELNQDLLTLAAAKTQCAGCHGAPAAVAGVLGGVGMGATFAAWRVFSGDPKTAGSLAGTAFTGLVGLATQLGLDPRVPRCAITGLEQSLAQRPTGERARAPLARALDAYSGHGEDVMAAARSLTGEADYAVDLVTPKLKGASLYGLSGAHFLSRDGWRTVLTAMSPAAESLDYPDALDPGSEEATSEWYVPTGTYFHAVDHLARRAAKLIVANELVAGLPAASRRMLTGLPDGRGLVTDSAVITAQIKTLWHRLTGDDPETLAPLMQTYLSLFNDAQGTTSEDAAANAWATVLTAMLTHPSFVVY